MRQQMIDAVVIHAEAAETSETEILTQLRNISPAARYVVLRMDFSEALAKAAGKAGSLFMLKPLGAQQLDRAIRHFLDY